MAIARKTDAAKIEAFLDALPEKFGLDSRQKQWAPFIFRFEDLTNVPKILARGALLSRNRRKEEGIQCVDCADEDIITQSQAASKYARLYWRPRTPMQYRVQGIRTDAQRTDNNGKIWPHCPTLTFLMFEARGLLTRAACEFSNGSLASVGRYKIGSDIAFLRKIPFADVYHYGPYPAAELKDRVFHRHAEVLIPDELDLADLRWIVCRSGPVRDTLLDLLGENAVRWRDKIRLEYPTEGLFDPYGTFLRDIWLDRGKLVIEPVPYAGPFAITLRVWDLKTNDQLLNKNGTLPSLVPRYIAALPTEPRAVRVEFLINSYLAYQGDIRVKTGVIS